MYPLSPPSAEAGCQCRHVVGMRNMSGEMERAVFSVWFYLCQLCDFSLYTLCHVVRKLLAFVARTCYKLVCELSTNQGQQLTNITDKGNNTLRRNTAVISVYRNDNELSLQQEKVMNFK